MDAAIPVCEDEAWYTPVELKANVFDCVCFGPTGPPSGVAESDAMTVQANPSRPDRPVFPERVVSWFLPSFCTAFRTSRISTTPARAIPPWSGHAAPGHTTSA